MKLGLTSLKEGFLIFSWALYDLANQFFALNIVSLYFVQWLTLEKKVPDVFYGISFGVSTVFIALLAPILGAISDATGRRKPPLVFLTLLSIVFTMFLGVKESIFLNLVFFAIANFGCSTATVFYNALMVNIAPRNRLGLISGLGKACSYAGAILALYFMKPVVLEKGYQATFLPTGILFLIFSLPCLMFVKDSATLDKRGWLWFFKKDKIIEIFAALRKTAFNVSAFPGLLDFLKAEFFGLCAVNAVVLFMSVYARKAFGLDEAGVIRLIGFSTLFAIAGSLLSGFLSDYLGHRRCLAAVFILWIICFAAGAFAKNQTLYLVIGALVGITLGGTWVVSRSLAIDLVPSGRIGEVFGLFNLVGYVSAIVGAIFWGLITLLLNRFGELGYRIALFSLVAFMIPGLSYLLRIPVKEKGF